MQRSRAGGHVAGLDALGAQQGPAGAAVAGVGAGHGWIRAFTATSSFSCAEFHSRTSSQWRIS